MVYLREQISSWDIEHVPCRSQSTWLPSSSKFILRVIHAAVSIVHAFLLLSRMGIS